MVQNIVTSTRHVIYDGVCVDADASCTTGLDHVAELLTGSVTSVQFVGDWLIVEPPGVKLTILRPLVAEDRLRNWENFYAHPAHLGQVRALLFDVLMRPSEHLDNASLLAVLINRRLIDGCSLPDEVD